VNELRFDENLAIREVLDDIIGMVARREKLIISASQQAVKTRDERMTQHVKKLEELMADFLVLFDPILDKVRSYGESLRESISDSEAYLKSITRIIEAGKTIEGASATLRELEKDADGVQGELEQSTDTLDKIEDLFERTNQYTRAPSASRSAEADRPFAHQLPRYDPTPSTLRREKTDRRPTTSSSSGREETDRGSTHKLSPMAPVSDYEDSISHILSRARLSSHEPSKSQD
jgi:hypothetical protein